MDREELQQTDIWTLFQQGQDYARMIDIFNKTDLNFRMFNGDQNEGLIVEGIEKLELNYIKPIVRYKVGVVISNNWAINYSSENFENNEFKATSENVCKLLNKKAAKIWERENIDKRIQKICKNAAINGECVVYVEYDKKKATPKIKILSKVDVYYGNENNDEIEEQPYILIKQRVSVIEARDIAKEYGVSEDKIQCIMGDNQNQEESGEEAKLEKDEMVTIVTKLYKKDGKVHFAKATRYCDIKKDTDTGLTYYPVIHLIWEEKEGSARGQGEVEPLIANQLEVNKTLMRRALVTKLTAYATKVVNVDQIENPEEVNTVGAVIRVNGDSSVQDVNKVFTNITPAQMSPDVKLLMNDLINVSRELANASDVASGSLTNSTLQNASGRAILAVQQAAQQPLKEQVESVKYFIECFARILLDHIKTYNSDGLLMEEEVVGQNGETETQLIPVQGSILEKLQADVKVDVTPKGSFDKFAQEQSLENLLKAGYFSVQRLPELKVYLETLDDDSVMPKQRILKVIKKMEEEQQKIAQINAEAELMKQRAMQFINNDPDAQAQQLSEASMQQSV